MENVTFEVFEGPLDLLLNLISKNEIDIYDIPIAQLTEQYMQYMYTANELNIDLASEFIVVAAQLIEIKSKMLLPPEVDENEEEIDPREELIARLLEYTVYKNISSYMKTKEENYFSIVEKDPEYFPQLKDDYANIDINAEMLAKALRAVCAKYQIRLKESVFDYTLHREDISVEEMIIALTEKLDKEKELSFFSLFEANQSRGYVIAVFLAILEMLKSNIITLIQDELFSDITIEKA